MLISPTENSCFLKYYFKKNNLCVFFYFSPKREVSGERKKLKRKEERQYSIQRERPRRKTKKAVENNETFKNERHKMGKSGSEGTDEDAKLRTHPASGVSYKKEL